METFYGPPYDFRPTSEYNLWLNYWTNPFLDAEEKLQLGQWLNGLPPTYGEWYFQYAERMGLENEGATTQPNPDEGSWNDLLAYGRGVQTIAIIGLVVYGLSQILSLRKK